MITELRVGDYIEKSELDTEQKYSDVVEVFEQWGFKFNESAVSNYSSLGNDSLSCCKDGLWQTYKDYTKNKRKLTYNNIMSLKKVDVDNCNIDKVVSLGEAKSVELCAGGVSVGYESFEKIKPSDGDVVIKPYIKPNIHPSLLDGSDLNVGNRSNGGPVNSDPFAEPETVEKININIGGEGDEYFREDQTIKQISKLSKAVLAMESLGHEWDEEKGQ